MLPSLTHGVNKLSIYRSQYNQRLILYREFSMLFLFDRYRNIIKNRDIDILLDISAMHDINEPVCIMSSYIDRSKYFKEIYTEEEEIRNLYSKNVDYIIKKLKKNNIQAVRWDSIEAENPKNIVISPTGFQTPFLNQEDTIEAIRNILNILNKSHRVLPLSHPSSLVIKQLSTIKEKEYSPEINLGHVQNPNKETLDKIKEKYGKSLKEIADDMITIAKNNGIKLSEEDKKAQYLKIKSENEIYSGRNFAKETYFIQARNNLEGRMLIYATKNFSDAIRYCGYKDDISKVKKDVNIGFVHIYESQKEQQYWDDLGIETGGLKKATKESEKDAETSIVKWKNPHLATIIYLGDCYFEIPKDNKHPDYEKWQDFMEIFTISYSDNPHMENRRKNILSEAELNNGNAVRYNILGEINKDDAENIKINKLKPKERISNQNEAQQTKKIIINNPNNEDINSKGIDISDELFGPHSNEEKYIAISESNRNLELSRMNIRLLKTLKITKLLNSLKTNILIEENTSNQTNKNNQNKDARNTFNER